MIGFCIIFLSYIKGWKVETSKAVDVPSTSHQSTHQDRYQRSPIQSHLGGKEVVEVRQAVEESAEDTSTKMRKDADTECEANHFVSGCRVCALLGVPLCAFCNPLLFTYFCEGP